MVLDKAAARDRYRRALTKAQMADLLRMISGDSADLISFEEVASRMKARQRIEMGTRMVPIDKIVGSVGRYRDFTRGFLPRSGADQMRWTNLDAAMNALESIPPIELYQIGDVYFVRDGNHRVSVARANDVSHMEAYVTEFPTEIPLSADDFERDEWIIKVERAEFQEQTQLDELRPGNELRLTEPGRYPILLHHIEVHRYLKVLDLARAGSKHSLSWDEAVMSWYDHVYMPMVEAIRKYEVLDNFPGRTEADLYLWIAYHRERLAQDFELSPLSPETAVSTFAEVHSARPLARHLKTLRLGLHRLLQNSRPLGMSEEEYAEYRARYAAGEISLGEAQQRRQGAAAA